MVTPSEKSAFFPSRKGTLNYYDDKTHKYKPVNFLKTRAFIEKNGFKIKKSKKQYKPLFFFIIGFFKEFFNPKKTNFYAWSFYGFEMVIVAKKLLKKV